MDQKYISNTYSNTVASGFDAAAGDELGGCFVTPACYAHMTHMLMTLANGKVAVCLEVGYSLLTFPHNTIERSKLRCGKHENNQMLISTS